MQHNYAAHNTRYNTTPHTQNTISHTILHNIDITIHINLNTRYNNTHRTEHLHTTCTQNAHTQHREQNTEYNNMQHTEQDTENAHRTHTEHSALHYIVLIFMMNTYISKNSIIQLYTKLIHFGHLINKVSKITITLIHIKTLYTSSNRIQ